MHKSNIEKVSDDDVDNVFTKYRTDCCLVLCALHSYCNDGLVVAPLLLFYGYSV